MLKTDKIDTCYHTVHNILIMIMMMMVIIIIIIIIKFVSFALTTLEPEA